MADTDEYIFIYYKDFAETVTTNFHKFLEDDVYIDLIFVCQNNEKVGAHQVVLGCLSKFFYSIFVDNVNTAKEKVIHIYVPDIRAKMMEHILQFIYLGRAMLNKEELEEFNEDIKLLGMPLDHFSAPGETTENNEKPFAEKALRKSAPRVPLAVSDTVDLTDTSNDNIEEVSSSNIKEPSSRETPAEATTPAHLPTASDAKTNDTPSPPLIIKNPPVETSSAKSSVAEIRITSACSTRSSDASKSKLLKSSEPRNRTTSTSSNSSSDVAMNKPLISSESRNRIPPTNSSSTFTTAIVPGNKSNVVASETTVLKIPENNAKMIQNKDWKSIKSRNLPPPSKRGKYLTASIDLDESDNEDVITLS